jgi:LysM repeat protein
MSAMTADAALVRTVRVRTFGSVPISSRSSVPISSRSSVPISSRSSVPISSRSSVPIQSGGALRLTRRGRFAFLAVGAVLAGSVVVGGAWASAHEPRNATVVATHTVVPGETLWSIAAAIATSADDIRVIVDDLVQLNSLPNAGLRAGQQILVPAAG